MTQTELQRRRELERLSKPELITKVIECERALAEERAGREAVGSLGMPQMWKCARCPLIIVGDRPDDITEHQADHQGVEK